MKIHYFQRYHAKENVATANTMLLLSRLYNYSTDKFYRFLKSEFFANNDFEPGLVFNLQERSKDSIPDATITQEGFKIIVETKLTDWFYSQQLMNHLKAFGSEKHKVLLTVASEPMHEKKKTDFEKQLKAFNDTQTYPVLHINTTFENLANAVGDVINENDHEMQVILEDYLNYCYTDGLIPVSDAWKYMRVQLAGATIDYNIASGVYYDKADRGFRPHDYLGLYTNKSVRAVGKIVARMTAVETEHGMQFKNEFGGLTEERKKAILDAIEDGVSYGYDLRTEEHRYFFVDTFYATDFKKITPRPPMGTRIFDLTQILGTEDIPETSELATVLRNKSWG